MSDEFPNRVHQCRRDTIGEEKVVITDEPLLSKNRVPQFGLRVSSFHIVLLIAANYKKKVQHSFFA